MFEKFSQLAEQAATNVSRRQFLGQVGRGAMTVAAVVGGLLALPNVAQAGGGRACSGPLTSAECQGKNVGDLCTAANVSGKCRNNRNSRNCYCAADVPR